MNLMDLMQFQLSDQLVNGLDRDLGIGNSQKTQAAAMGAISTLMTALTKNASSENGVSALTSALDRDHDGSILDDVLGMVLGQRPATNTRMTNGSGILGHLLGNNQGNVINMLSQMTGLDDDKSMGLLVKLAPMVLGTLGRVKKQKGLDPRGVHDYLSQSQQSFKMTNQNASVFERMLDRDGDGSVADEVLGMGMKFLGSLLKK